MRQRAEGRKVLLLHNGKFAGEVPVWEKMGRGFRELTVRGRAAQETKLFSAGVADGKERSALFRGHYCGEMICARV